MPVTFSESKPPVSLVQLDELQRRLKIQLPENYREFLVANNGGRPKPAIFTFVGDKGRQEGSSIQFFLGVYDGKYSNFERTFNTFKVRAKRMPEELVPIANDELGNYICLAVAGNSMGAVYFWDHENEADEGEEPSYNNVHMIKPSLREFLDSLH